MIAAVMACLSLTVRDNDGMRVLVQQFCIIASLSHKITAHGAASVNEK